MSQDYADTAREVYAALREDGALVTVAWSVTPDYDPAAGEPVPVAVTATTYGVILDYPTHKIGTQPDSLIRAGDRQLLMAVLDQDGADVPEPPPEAVVTAAYGARYVVRNCAALDPAGVAVMFDITVRR